MSNAWCRLEYRYGKSTEAPTRDEISAALKELYHEGQQGMTEGDYEEHGAASLRFGYDEGPLYVLEISRHGTARWEEWADPDYEVELCPRRESEALSQDQGALLWELLAAGEVDGVREYFQTI